MPINDPDIQALLAQGRSVEAVRLLQSRDGWSAEDALAAVEAAQPPPGLAGSAELADVWREIDEALRSGQKIVAIKRQRELTGQGLAEAKAAVEARARVIGLPGGGSGCVFTTAKGVRTSDNPFDLNTLRFVREALLRRSGAGRGVIRVYEGASEWLCPVVARSKLAAAWVCALGSVAARMCVRLGVAPAAR